MHTDEDQPAAIQVEDDEQIAYFDEATGYFYDSDGFIIEMALPETGSEEDLVEQAELMNQQDDLQSALEIMNRNKKKQLEKKKRVPKSAIQRTRRVVPEKFKEDDTQKQNNLENDATKSQTVSVSKSYISQLENELNQEKVARMKLQNDIEQIKQINSEISEKLGLKVEK